jgi:alpha-galactosidase
LYVYGFDVPEAYAIEKNGHMYYAFYAPSPTREARTGERTHWSGELELRGLSAKTYRVTDYVHHQDLGTVTGPLAKLKVNFQDSLLLEAVPAP